MTSRRVFLKSGAMAMVALGFAPSFLARTAEAAGTRKKLLISVFQRGAVDGLNMVVPIGEADYYRSRPSIAIARPGGADSAIDLNGFFGLHPRLSAFKPLWDRGELAIVHACGSHDTTRSHFDAQDYMESATPGVKSTKDGWLNRYLQVRGTGVGEPKGSPLQAVALTPQMPRSLQGAAPALAVGRTADFDVSDMGAKASFEEIYEAAKDRTLHGTAGETFEAMRMLAQKTTGIYRPANGAVYPRSPFGQALQEIARLAKSDVGLEIAFAESTQWDHHVNEGAATGQIANRLDDFSRGIAALAQDLGERMADTVILTMSEFGRAVAENGSRGTDHGHGNAMFLIGGSVKGREVYGKWPGLAPADRFEGRDLAVTTDFRDVFSEVVVKHLGADAATATKVFPGYQVKPGTFRAILRS
ncbi:MAG: hypothetical protein A3J29_05970 [Acidobacteria bacterium RIFCSPLOWO2_12_FULL_67_14b]|nr:MAG: hypothetical protein A3J29_05970 [Acidobacteria bacterium RIFCSPLOWO2_12_FULL_67_14b]